MQEEATSTHRASPGSNPRFDLSPPAAERWEIEVHTPARAAVTYRSRLDRVELTRSLQRRFRRRQLRRRDSGRRRICHAIRAFLGSTGQHAERVAEELEASGAIRFAKGFAKRARWRFDPERAERPALQQTASVEL